MSGNRVTFDDAGDLDEVVTDAGMHLERMDRKTWFLCGQRSDGSEIAVWIKGKVMRIEERPPGVVAPTLPDLLSVATDDEADAIQAAAARLGRQE